MAHIVRIGEFQSRYQTDLQRYPSQFTRIKKEKWHYLQESSKREMAEGLRLEYEDMKHEATIWSRAIQQVKNWTIQDKDAQSEKERENETLTKLKAQYKQEMFEMQLLWAGAVTDEHKEQLDVLDLKQDAWLQFLALEIPDNCFVFYKPIMYVKRAEIELDVLLVSPSSLYCITLLKGDPLSVFEATSERYWVEYIHQQRKKRLSPIPSLTRMDRVVTTILEEHHIDFPVKSIVVSPEAIIDHRTVGLPFECVDRRSFKTWTQKLSQSAVPLKHQQVKAAESLLTYCDPKPITEFG